MQGVSVILVLGILARWSCSAVFLNHRPFPRYSLENMPSTQFTCREKILGGYYADPDTQCQMFHICVKVAGVGVQDFRFLCPNGTAFDQDHQICADWEDVDCDATTLYYSSDNFDLYRIGSGFESKAHRYGEDEETFALQRAETGDARINKEPQTQTVNQQKDYQKPQPRRNNNNNNNNNSNNNNNNNNNQDREIFRASSSSNFFNNRNNGKETDEDYDDNINVNQNRDYEQKRKVIRKQVRRPVSQNNDQAPRRPVSQNNDQEPIQPQQQSSANNRNGNGRQQSTLELQKTPEVQTRKPQRPTGFVNNFAGSSYVPTTQRVSTTTLDNDQYTTASNNNNNFRRGQRQRITNAGTFATSNQNSNPQTLTYTVSTPAPFRQSSAAIKQTNNGQYYTSSTENYPTPRLTKSSVNHNQNYDVPKVTKSTENYPSNNPKYVNPTTPLVSPQYSTAFDKKPTSPKKFESKPTTFSPNAKPFSIPSTLNTQQNTQNFNSLPTTFAPRTQQAYTQIAQQTNTFNTQNGQQTNTFNQPSSQTTNFNTQKTQSTNGFTQQKLSTFGQSFSSPLTTQRTTAFTQYTPTVPKISSTTPVSRSNRFDETQYDDGSYDSKYDSSGSEDEFLKTAHSQNIASNRNEFAKIQKQHQQQPSTTQKPYEAPKTYYTTTYSPRTTENYPKSTQFASVRNTQVTQKPVEKKLQEPAAQPVSKKVKNVSYDYAYYDSFGSEPDYQLDTEIKKSNLKN